MKDTLEKLTVAFTATLLLDFVDPPRGPGVDRWVHIAKVPLVGWNLAIGMHVPLAKHQRELFLGEVRIYKRERNTVERQVPCRIPGVFPLVGHGDDVSVMHMPPLVIATIPALRRRERIAGITIEPLFNDIMIELFRPKHARDGLTHDVLWIWSEAWRGDCGVELIGFPATFGEGRIEARAEGPARGRGHLFVSEAKLYNDGLPRPDLERIMAGHFRPRSLGVHRFLGAVHDVVVD